MFTTTNKTTITLFCVWVQRWYLQLNYPEHGCLRISIRSKQTVQHQNRLRRLKNLYYCTYAVVTNIIMVTLALKNRRACAV
jgi:hypothetical protein